ncbi:unnamed protein product [Arctia plantaginis]|uniref:Uncharacterized protein n=1 Tax=Arctia plantaginis TaxID=874455 RepID=A0A8S0YLE4_ARCPL|nr:unnamed protein product [Arctia plantaginis]
MNYNWLVIASLTTLSFSYGEETKVKNKTTNKLNSKSPSDRWQAKKKFIGSWMEHVRRQWEDEEPDPERGPVRESNYNPNYGYEPYWPGGEWVHVTTPTPKTRKTEASPRTQKTEYSPRLLGDMNCGLKCGVIYKT